MSLNAISTDLLYVAFFDTYQQLMGPLKQFLIGLS